jgi:hypothetical protein
MWGRGCASYSLADGVVPLLARLYALYWSAGTYKAVLRAEVEEEYWHMKSQDSSQTTTWYIKVFYYYKNCFAEVVIIVVVGTSMSMSSLDGCSMK